MSKILCIGSITKDIFFPTSEGVTMDTPEDVLSQKKIAFELGAKYHIKKRYESLGGCSVNVAAGLAKLGENVSLYTILGDDATGEWILKEIKKINVDIKELKILQNSKSDMSAIVVDEKSADRIIFSNQVANHKLVVNEEKIGNPEWIFIGDLSGEWEKNLDTITKYANKKSIKLAFNPRQKNIHENCSKNIETISQCEILFVNKDEAIEILSNSSISENSNSINDEKYLLKELKKIGVSIVVLTDGIRGAWVYDGKEILHVDAILQEKIVDTTGAGDAFASGFLAAHLKGKIIKESLKWGIANSSHSVIEYGGQKGLLNEEEIILLAEKAKIHNFN